MLPFLLTINMPFDKISLRFDVWNIIGLLAGRI